jgi:hypothetical protein
MDTPPGPENRREPRSNMFVIATLYGADGSAPVRIRNMSRGGALVEGGVLPSIGAEVRLCRGSLGATGNLVWLAGPRAGLHFTGAVEVADWLPNGARVTEQGLADEMVHQARLGTVPAPIEPEAGPLSIKDELLRLSRSLERAGEDLATDMDIAARHSRPLQLIDMAAQALARLGGDRSATQPLIDSVAL